MKFSHIIGFGVFAVLLIIIQFKYAPIPWGWIKGLGALSIGVGLIYFLSGTNSSKATGLLEKFSIQGSKDGMNLDPMAAPQFINNEIERKKEEGISTPERKLNLDHTDWKNEDIRRKARKSERYNRWLCAIIGPPENQQRGELVAYVVDLTSKTIWDYSGELETPEERNEPFAGKYSHLFDQVDRETEEDNGSPLVRVDNGRRGGGEDV